MSKISSAEVKRLYRRNKAGESLTAVEWANISVWHADRAIKLSKVGMALAVLALLLMLVSVAIRAAA